MSMGKLYPKDASRNKGQFGSCEGNYTPPNRLQPGVAHELYGEAGGLSGPRITRIHTNAEMLDGLDVGEGVGLASGLW